MSKEHTPGPWEAVLDSDPRGQPVCYYRGLIALVERGKRTLAVVLGPGHAYDSVPEEQWEPNAKLIAAAPALADALEAILATCGEPYTTEEYAALEQANSALTLAGRRTQ